MQLYVFGASVKSGAETLEIDEAPWDVRFRDAPAWAYVDPMRFSPKFTPPQQLRRVRLCDLIISFFRTVRFFLIDQHRVDAVVFITNRSDSHKFCQYLRHRGFANYALFLNPERGETPIRAHYSTCTALNVIRFGFRLVARVMRSSRARLVREFAERGYPLSAAQQGALFDFMGDALFNDALSSVTRRGLPIFYANSVVPMSERFQSRLDSREVQHGVIHRDHPDYATARTVRHTLIVYDEIYREILMETGYDGRVVVWPFKGGELSRAGAIEHPRYDIALFTQPIPGIPSALESLALSCVTHGLQPAVQRHPRDYHSYHSLPPEMLVNSIGPEHAKVALSFCSTSVEVFLTRGRDILLYDVTGSLVDDYSAIVEVFRRFEKRDGGKIWILHTEEEVINRLSA